MWLLAVGVGMVFGKTIIHGILLSRFLRLKMFRADQVRRIILTDLTKIPCFETSIFKSSWNGDTYFL